MRKIYLIGMPGSGKTTLGKQLSDRLHLPFIDLDDEIIKDQKLSINEIFKKYGESHFREVERQTLVKTSKANDAFILATGGGAPCFFDNMEYMNQDGSTIFLDVSPNILFDRLKDQNAHRPLLKDRSEETLRTELHDKVSNRIRFYNKSKIILRNDNITLDMLIKAINKYHNK